MRRIVLAAALASLAGAAHAEVVESFDVGFRLKNTVEIAAPADRVYRALGEIGRWWSDEHTYSGKAANLTVSMQAGGCFCEVVDGGSVQHAVVVLALPGQTLRLNGALGPLQEEGVSSTVTFQINPMGSGVELVQTGAVGGARPEVARQWAGPVDQVLRTQLQRFKRYVETGRP